MTSLKEITFFNMKNCGISGTSLGLLLKVLTNLRIETLILDGNQLGGKDSIEYLAKFFSGFAKEKLGSISLKGCGIEGNIARRLMEIGKEGGVDVIF